MSASVESRCWGTDPSIQAIRKHGAECPGTHTPGQVSVFATGTEKSVCAYFVCLYPGRTITLAPMPDGFVPFHEVPPQPDA